MSRHLRLFSPKAVLGQFLANFQMLGQAIRKRRARRGSGPDGPAGEKGNVPRPGKGGDSWEGLAGGLAVSARSNTDGFRFSE